MSWWIKTGRSAVMGPSSSWYRPGRRSCEERRSSLPPLPDRRDPLDIVGWWLDAVGAHVAMRRIEFDGEIDEENWLGARSDEGR